MTENEKMETGDSLSLEEIFNRAEQEIEAEKSKSSLDESEKKTESDENNSDEKDSAYTNSQIRDVLIDERSYIDRKKHHWRSFFWFLLISSGIMFALYWIYQYEFEEGFEWLNVTASVMLLAYPLGSFVVICSLIGSASHSRNLEQTFFLELNQELDNISRTRDENTRLAGEIASIRENNELKSAELQRYKDQFNRNRKKIAQRDEELKDYQADSARYGIKKEDIKFQRWIFDRLIPVIARQIHLFSANSTITADYLEGAIGSLTRRIEYNFISMENSADQNDIEKTFFENEKLLERLEQFVLDLDSKLGIEPTVIENGQREAILKLKQYI